MDLTKAYALYIFEMLSVRASVEVYIWRSSLNFIAFLFLSQAFSVLSDKLNPLVEGVRDNKVHWLQLAQNAQNNPNHVPHGGGDGVTKSSVSMNNNNNNNNNNSDDSKNKGQKMECNGGMITDSNQIPKIVGKLGRLDSQIFYQKQNGSIGESRDHSDDAMEH